MGRGAPIRLARGYARALCGGWAGPPEWAPRMEPVTESRESRLLFFCPPGARVDRLEWPLQMLLERIAAPPAELAAVETAGALDAAGWRAFLVRSTTGRSAAHAMAAHVTEATAALAQELGAAVMGLYVDLSGDGARLSRCAPGATPETFAGQRDAVLTRAAAWLQVPPAGLTPFFRAGDEPDDEPDADDRYVEDKLRQAREWYARWRQAGK